MLTEFKAVSIAITAMLLLYGILVILDTFTGFYLAPLTLHPLFLMLPVVGILIMITVHRLFSQSALSEVIAYVVAAFSVFSVALILALIERERISNFNWSVMGVTQDGRTDGGIQVFTDPLTYAGIVLFGITSMLLAYQADNRQRARSSRQFDAVD